MDIVERAAVLLGATSGPAGPRADRESRSACIVERLERGMSQAADHAAGAAPAKRAERQTSRTVTTDAAWMREQRIITPAERRTMMTESFRRVKRHILANVARADADAAKNLVMITSALPGEGKTFCAVNLAISIAMEVDRTVLLVDADFEHPSVPAAMGIESDDRRGFIDVIADPEVHLSDVLLKTDIGKLTVLPAGTPHQHATELLAGERAAALQQELAGRYRDRIVVYDSAPLLSASESAALAAHMGQIVVVVEAGRTTEQTLREALGRVESCSLAGVLLNKGAASRAHADYGYGHGSP